MLRGTWLTITIWLKENLLFLLAPSFLLLASGYWQLLDRGHLALKNETILQGCVSRARVIHMRRLKIHFAREIRNKRDLGFTCDSRTKFTSMTFLSANVNHFGIVE